MKRRTKICLLSATLLSALACTAHAAPRLIDLNSGTFFEGVVSTNSIAVSYTPSPNYNSAQIVVYDSTGQFVGSTPNINPDGSKYSYTIRIPSFYNKAPYLVCMILDGKCVYTMKVS